MVALSMSISALAAADAIAERAASCAIIDCRSTMAAVSAGVGTVVSAAAAAAGGGGGGVSTGRGGATARGGDLTTRGESVRRGESVPRAACACSGTGARDDGGESIIAPLARLDFLIDGDELPMALPLDNCDGAEVLSLSRCDVAGEDA